MQTRVLMLTDVVGSTRLWTAEPAEMDAAMARHHSLVHAAVAEHGGWRPVDQGEGDSVFAVFASATGALACAAQVQRSLAAEPWPTSAPLTVRIAVHLGEVVERDGNLFGDSVNRCARLRALASGGQVLLSAAVRETVRDRMPAGLGVIDLGEHYLKDLARPERVWQLTGDGLDGPFLLPTGLHATREIAVLVTTFEEPLSASGQGAEQYVARRRAHSTAVRQAVAGRGAETAVVRDGVMAVFETAAEAVRCATTIQQALQQGRRTEPVRVGVSWGTATSVDGAWCNGPVQEAEQLCAAAGPGQILAAAAVADLLDRHGDLRLDEAPQVLRAGGEPVRVLSVDWRAAASSPAPLPAGVAHAVGPTLFGRGDESEVLARWWRHAKAGRQQVALVGGEPGVGKTRLVAELARTAHGEGALVLWGHCDEELAVAYQPFAEALRRWAAQAGSGQDVVAGSPELRQLLSHAPADGPSGMRLGEDLEGKRLMLFHAVSDLLTQLAAERPVVLVLDDVHWATAPTLLMLRHVIREATSAAVLLLATYRDNELERDHPLTHLLGDLRREPTAHRLALAGLSVSAVGEYVEAVAGGEPGSVGLELATDLRQHTEGNAFFLQQVLRHLAESGGVVRTDGRWRLTAPLDQLGLPEGVREVVGRRLARFSGSTRRTLTVAAVIGRDFDLRSLEDVLPDAGDELLDQLEEAVRARLVDEVAGLPGRFSFSHALVRQTLLVELSAARRARLHRAVGEALARQEGASPARVAYHLCAGATAESVAAGVSWTTRAMEQARDHTAFEEAVALGDQALHALDVLARPSLADRSRLLTLSAMNRVLCGDLDGARRLAEESIDTARRAAVPLLLAEAVYQRFRWPRLGTPEHGAAELFEEALAGLGDDPAALRARSRLLTAHAAYRGFSLSQGLAAEPMARQAVEVARQSGDLLVEFEALLTCGTLAMGSSALSTLHDVVDGMDRLLAAAPGHAGRDTADPAPRTPSSPDGSPTAQGRYAAVPDWRTDSWAGIAPFGIAVRVIAHLMAGDRPRAEAAIAIMRGVHEQRGGAARLPAAWTGMWQALLDLADGRLDAAETHTAQLLEMAATEANFGNSWAALSFQIAQEKGRAAELLPVIRHAVEQSPGVVALQVILARALVEAGEADEAAALFTRLSGSDLSEVPRDMVWSTSLGQLAELCLLLDDRAAAASLYDALLPFSGQVLVSAWGVYCLGAADRFLGALAALLGRHQEVDARFGGALALEEGMDAPALVARTRLWWAQALIRGGDATRAEEVGQLLDQVLLTAQPRGLVALLREAERTRGWLEVMPARR